MNSPVTETRAIDRRLKRCAVFKIDLKGRFVYIDDLTEDILHCPRESLFGRDIKGFLTEDSHSTLRTIFQRCRHYETFFEAVELNFVSAQGEGQPYQAVISLNFIAGNPANYQVVLLPVVRIPAVSTDADLFAAVRESISDSIAATVANIDWKGLTALLLKHPAILQNGIYEFENNRLRLLGASSVDYSYQIEFADIALSREEFEASRAAGENVKCTLVSIGEQDGPPLADLWYSLVCRGEKWGILRIITRGDYQRLDVELRNLARYLGNALYSFAI